MRSALDTVRHNLAAYNRRDLATFLESFDQAVEMIDLREGTVTARGADQVSERYRDLFAASPNLHSFVLRRSVVADLVCDHELVTGRAGGDVEILITYQVSEGAIRRVWFARAPAVTPVIVRAAPEDRDKLIELGCATYREHFATIWSPTALERFLATHFDPDAIDAELRSNSVAYLVAADSGLAAFAKLRFDRPSPLDGGVGAELQKIYVRREATGRGLGRLLLAAAEREACERRQALLWLDVLKTNLGAVRFYQAQGFEIRGQLPFATDVGEHGMWIMHKAVATDGLRATHAP